MEKKELIVTQKNALLETANNYIVAVGYDAEKKTWNHGHYFEHWGNENKKAHALRNATEYFLTVDIYNYNYINRYRMQEILSAAIQNLDQIGMTYFLEDAQLEDFEIDYFGIRESEEY